MTRIRYYIVFLILICFSLNSKIVYSWGYWSHAGMTGAAAREVFNLNTSKTAKKIDTFKVNIKYDMQVDFGKTVGMGLGILGTPGVLESFVGSIIDVTVLKDKFKVDHTMAYPTLDKKKEVNTLYKIMREAGTHPDSIDAETGLIGKGDMLLGHIYAPNGLGFTDIMAEFCYGNAVNAWTKNKNESYVWLSYASHYLVDAGIPVHAEADYRNLHVLQWQLRYHTFTEKYISHNWKKYKATADSAAKSPMPVCDIGATVRSLAMETYPDLAEWNKAWGQTGGGDYEEGDEPANVKKFDELVKREIWRCVPRIAGLFMKFKEEVIDKGKK